MKGKVRLGKFLFYNLQSFCVLKKAYIIAAHKYPTHLLRLIKRLDDGHSTFFIHIDKSVDIDKFEALNAFGSKIKWVDRVRSNWATMGQVNSTLNAMKAIVASGEPFEMVSFISGQDYPIKSNEEIDHFFKTSEHSIFLDYFPLPDYDKWKDKGGMWRVNKYFFGLEPRQLFLSKSANLLSSVVPFFRRQHPTHMQAYVGSAWFSMDLDAIKYVLKYVEENPKYVAYQKNGFSPDELFYIMILVNSPDKSITQRIQNNNKRLIKWKNWSTSNPETLTIKNFDEIAASDALYARKFDPFVDNNVLDLIDKNMLQKYA